MITINNKDECCGCGVCAYKCPQSCISMTLDKEGFLYPNVNSSLCIDCGQCDNVCTFRNNETSFALEPMTIAANNKNALVRMNSSSGGVFSLLAELFVEGGGLVYGVSFISNCLEGHFERIDNLNDLYLLRGSKYFQVNPNTVYYSIKNDLNNNKNVLFSGTACQINALYGFLGKSYDNLYCVDVICHGTPSVELWKKYMSSIFKNQMDDINVNFRSKKFGWENYGLQINYNGKERFITKTESSYMQFFLRDICLRPSCYNCKAKTRVLSDLSLGDLWGIDDICPELNDHKGTSLVLIRSEKGNRLFTNIKNNLTFKHIQYSDAIVHNPSIYKSVSKPKERNQFYEDMLNLSYRKLAKKYCGSLLKRLIINRIKTSSFWQVIRYVRK